jgi:hypothetical protein
VLDVHLHACCQVALDFNSSPPFLEDTLPLPTISSSRQLAPLLGYFWQWPVSAPNSTFQICVPRELAS